MLKAYIDQSALLETYATCGLSSGEGKSMAPLKSLSEPEEQFSLEDKQNVPNDTHISPKRVQETGLSSLNITQGSPLGQLGSPTSDIDQSPLCAPWSQRLDLFVQLFQETPLAVL